MGMEIFKIQKADTGVVFKSSIKFTGKHLCQGLFFNMVAGLRPKILFKRHRCFPLNFVKLLRMLFFSKYESLYDSGRPQLSDKKLLWKCLENIQEHIYIGLQVTSSVKLKIGWIHITIEIRCHKTLKIISSWLYFSRVFLSWLICLGGGYF